MGAEYEKRLTTGTSYSAITMPVRPRPELSPKYVLMLFTRHTEGAWHFADAVGQAGVDLEEARYKSQMSQDTLFGSLPFDRPAHVNSALPRVAQVVERNIVRLLAESNPVQLAERVPEVYQGVLGQAWTRHARYAVKSLHSQGLIDHSGVGDFWKNPIRQL